MNSPVTSLLLCLLLSPFGARAESSLLLYSASGDGKSFEYAIPISRAATLPAWKAQAQVLPLSVNDAIAKARVWVRSKNPKFEAFVPNDVSIKRSASSEFGDVWYYSIGFDGVVGGVRMYSWSLVAVVLMDGSIVEPKVGKQ